MNKKILHIAIPSIISNLAVPLLSMVDTIIVGHLDGVYFIGAVAIGSTIFNFIYWGFGFLRMGTTGLTAQDFGRKDKPEVIHNLVRAAIVALAGSVFVLFLQIPLEILSFYLIDASLEVEQYARSYFYIRIWAAPATLLIYAFSGWFLGLQNARFPMILTLISNLANICFNLIFVYVYDMKSDGVALGTVAAQYLGLGVAIILFLAKYKKWLQFLKWQDVFHLEKIRQFFSINRDIFIRTICLIFVFAFFTAKSAEFGDDILAVNTILLQLWMIFSYGIDGFAFSAESLVGQYFGARDKKNLLKMIKLIFVWGVSLGVLFSLAYLLFGTPILSLFTDKTHIVLLASAFLFWTIAAPIVNSFCYIWDGVFIGLTAGTQMRNSMLLSTVIIFLPAWYISVPLWGNHGAWIAMLLFMIARWATLQIAFRKIIISAF